MKKRLSGRLDGPWTSEIRHYGFADGIFQRRIQALRNKREAKAEKERYEKMAEKMHKKRVERLKRREKRNKMLKS